MPRKRSNRRMCVVRCLLVVAAWQAPLPFWHSHGTLADETAQRSPWLAEHLRTHHAAVDPLCQFGFGWHLHFALPESSDEAPGGPKPIRQHIVVATGLTSWSGFARLQASLVAHACRDALSSSRISSADGMLVIPRRPCGFFTDFAPDMPLPARLGAMRC